MERALGEVPNVESVSWDWQEGVAFVRFAPGARVDEDALRRAVDEGTPFTAGDVTVYDRIEDMPDALR